MTSVRDGSSLYYALLWTEAVARERFINTLPLIAALDTTLDDVREPQVAEQKIHWWHEELERMVNLCARHPLTTAYQQTVIQQRSHTSSKHPALEACLAILGSAATERFTPATTESETRARQEQNFTGRLALLSHALSHDSDDLVLQSHSRSVAFALARHEQLIRLPYKLHRGHQVFSTETYTRHESGPSQLARLIRRDRTPVDTDELPQHDQHETHSHDDTVANARSLLHEAINSTGEAFDAAVSEPASTQRYRHSQLLPLWRLTVLRQNQLRLWQRQQPDLLKERSTLTPLRKFFIAWNNKR